MLLFLSSVGEKWDSTRMIFFVCVVKLLYYVLKSSSFLNVFSIFHIYFTSTLVVCLCYESEDTLDMDYHLRTGQDLSHFVREASNPNTGAAAFIIRC